MDFSSDFADSVPDPALSSQWLIRFPNTSDVFGSIPEEITVGFTKIPAKPRHGGGTNTYFPDFNDMGSMSVTFYETKDYACMKWINSWRKKIVNPIDGSYGVADDYKVKVTLELYSHESETPTYTIELEGVWPTEQADYSGSYEDSEGRIKIQVPFSVDSMNHVEI